MADHDPLTPPPERELIRQLERAADRGRDALDDLVASLALDHATLRRIRSQLADARHAEEIALAFVRLAERRGTA